MIRDPTNRSDDVDPVVFDRLPTWWIIINGGVSERFTVRRFGFFDEMHLFHVGLVDSKRFPPWRQQTISSFPVRSQTVRTDCASVRH